MKVIGICGSPRKGNTEWMLNTFMKEAARNGLEVETLILRKLEVQQCLGCLKCEERDKTKAGDCKIKDDMQSINLKLLSADAIVLATPVYFSLLSGLLKTFLDRTTPIWPALAGKKIAGLAVAEEDVGQAIQNLKTYGSLCKMLWIGSVKTLAKTPGQAAQNKRLEQRIQRLARKLL